MAKRLIAPTTDAATSLPFTVRPGSTVWASNLAGAEQATINLYYDSDETVALVNSGAGVVLDAANDNAWVAEGHAQLTVTKDPTASAAGVYLSESGNP